MDPYRPAAGSPEPVSPDPVAAAVTAVPAAEPTLPPGIAPPRAPHAPLAARQYLWLIGALVVLTATLHWLGPVLTPFLVGTILAYLGSPLVTRCARAGIPRSLGTLLAVVLMLGVVLALVLIIIPLLQAEMTLLLQRLPALADLYAAHIAPWIEQTLGMTVALDFATLRSLVTDNAQQAGAVGLKLLAGVRTGGVVVMGVLINVALVPVVMFYLLRDGHGIMTRMDELVPRAWLPPVRSMAREIDHVLSEFLHGQMLVMLSLATYYTLALFAVGLQFALPIGILTGLLVFIPYVGFGIGLLLGILAALLQWSGWPGFAAVLAVYGVGQLLENYVLIPYLVGHRIGLHPLAVIFALLAFGQLFGFAGVLLALPVSAMLLVVLRRLRGAYVDSPIYRA